jgi:hypothetical protein
MSFKQFEAAEFNHSYLNCLSWSCLRSYWQQIDDAVAKMNALGWKPNDNDAANIARDLDLIGETSESWKCIVITTGTFTNCTAKTENKVQTVGVCFGVVGRQAERNMQQIRRRN